MSSLFKIWTQSIESDDTKKYNDFGKLQINKNKRPITNDV